MQQRFYTWMQITEIEGAKRLGRKQLAQAELREKADKKILLMDYVISAGWVHLDGTVLDKCF